VSALSLGWNAAAKPMAVRAEVDGNALKRLVQAFWTLREDGLTMDAFKDENPSFSGPGTSLQELALEAGSPREIRLHPFEVLVFDCAPARRPLF